MDDDELSSRFHPGLPPEDETSDRHAINDGLYLRLGEEPVRLDHPDGLPQNMSDRDSVVAMALCELVVQRLLRANCTCKGKGPR